MGLSWKQGQRKHHWGEMPGRLPVLHAEWGGWNRMGFLPLILVITLESWGPFHSWWGMIETAEQHCLIFPPASHIPGSRMGRAAPSTQPAKATSTAQQNGARFPAKESLGASDLTSRHPSLFFLSIQRAVDTYPLATEQPSLTFDHTEEKKAAPVLLLCHPRKTGGHSKLRSTGKVAQILSSNFNCHKGHWSLL